jgi:hypothetical protein
MSYKGKFLTESQNKKVFFTEQLLGFNPINITAFAVTASSTNSNFTKYLLQKAVPGYNTVYIHSIAGLIYM